MTKLLGANQPSDHVNGREKAQATIYSSYVVCGALSGR
jgi:hypothetical protein